MSDTPATPSTNAAPGLKARLQADLTQAIRGRDELTAATLRMALTAIRSDEVAGTVARELSEDEVMRALAREAKKRREASAAFADAGRAEQAARELAELDVLQGYLPAQLSDDALNALITEAVAAAAAAGARGMPAMGKVMKVVQAQVAGRAEGGKVAAEVRRQLLEH